MKAITFGTGMSGLRSERSIGEGAQIAEQLGFDVFSFGEHPTNWGPDFDPFVQMAFAAAATKQIRVASQVTLLPLHHPVRLAHIVTSLDHLSQGRVIVGVGVGGEYPKQFEAFGIPVSERGRRTDEYLQILLGLWTQKSFSHRGEFFRFDDIVMEPMPYQQPHPPIWIGGRPGGTEIGPDGIRRYKSKVGAVRRAARFGQSWLPYHVTVDQVRSTTEQLRESAHAVGRNPDHITIGLNNSWLIRDTFEEALAEASRIPRYGNNLSERVRQYDLLGSPVEVIRRMEEYIAVGVTHFSCGWLAEGGDALTQMQIVARHVMPYFRN